MLCLLDDICPLTQSVFFMENGKQKIDVRNATLWGNFLKAFFLSEICELFELKLYMMDY